MPISPDQSWWNRVRGLEVQYLDVLHEAVAAAGLNGLSLNATSQSTLLAPHLVFSRLYTLVAHFKGGRPAARPAARRPALVRDVDASARRSAGRDRGLAGTHRRQLHASHLRPLLAGDAGGGGRDAGRSCDIS